LLSSDIITLSIKPALLGRQHFVLRATTGDCAEPEKMGHALGTVRFSSSSSRHHFLLEYRPILGTGPFLGQAHSWDRLTLGTGPLKCLGQARSCARSVMGPVHQMLLSRERPPERSGLAPGCRILCIFATRSLFMVPKGVICMLGASTLVLQDPGAILGGSWHIGEPKEEHCDFLFENVRLCVERNRHSWSCPVKRLRSQRRSRAPQRSRAGASANVEGPSRAERARIRKHPHV
jgi:hypothetical protein